MVAVRVAVRVVARPLLSVSVALLVPLACTTPTPPSPSVAPSASSSAVAGVVAYAVIDADPPDASPSASASPSVSASTASVESSPPPAPTGIVIGQGTRVFVFGDSMVNAGLGQRLEKLVEDRGGSYAENHWSSSTVKAWSLSERLPNLLLKYKPDVVFVTLGSNEVYYVDAKAAESVQRIVKKLDGRPCVWIGPPVWKTQKGIVEIERDNSAPCAFFDSQHLELDRQKDGIHPSVKGGAAWADAVWSASVSPSGSAPP